MIPDLFDTLNAHGLALFERVKPFLPPTAEYWFATACSGSGGDFTIHITTTDGPVSVSVRCQNDGTVMARCWNGDDIAAEADASTPEEAVRGLGLAS